MDVECGPVLRRQPERGEAVRQAVVFGRPRLGPVLAPGNGEAPAAVGGVAGPLFRTMTTTTAAAATTTSPATPHRR